MVVRLGGSLWRDDGNEVVQVVVKETEPGLKKYPVEALSEQIKEYGACPESEREHGLVIEAPLPLESLGANAERAQRGCS